MSENLLEIVFKEKIVRFISTGRLCFTTHDQQEGMQAFSEKRAANFKDC